MEREIPKMYQSKVNKPINSIQKVYSTMDNEDDNFIRGVKLSNKSISKKIDDIFNAIDYVYKADVTIITDSGKMTKRIVARDNDNLITIDNEYIPVSIIRDIYK